MVPGPCKEASAENIQKDRLHDQHGDSMHNQAAGWEACVLASKGCSAEAMRGACSGEAPCNGVPKAEQVQQRLGGGSVF